MTHHITQEQAVALWKAAAIANSNGEGFDAAIHAAMTAAIQRYIDQHKAELPVLPEPYFGSCRYLGAAGSRDAYTTTQIQTYGAACAAHARELALEEAKLIAKLCCSADDSAFGDGYNTAAFNIERDIEKLKAGK